MTIHPSDLDTAQIIVRIDCPHCMDKGNVPNATGTLSLCTNCGGSGDIRTYLTPAELLPLLLRWQALRTGAEACTEALKAGDDTAAGEALCKARRLSEGLGELSQMLKEQRERFTARPGGASVMEAGE